jgi:hypothetical protein
MLREENWNIAKEVLHLVWAYGQPGNLFRKHDLQAWSGQKLYESFFRLDADYKGFEVSTSSDNLCCLSFILYNFTHLRTR